MTWDADEREIAEAVSSGEAEWIWSAFKEAYRERDEARAQLATVEAAAREALVRLDAMGETETARALRAVLDSLRTGGSA